MSAVLYLANLEGGASHKVSLRTRTIAAKDFFKRNSIVGEPHFTETPRPALCGGEGYFSVSHSGNTWGAVFSLAPVALDFECFPISPRNFQGIAGRFFSNGEKDYFAAAEDKNAAFCDIWTRKEAAVKLSGKGLSGLSQADSTQIHGYIPLPPAAEKLGIRGHILFGESVDEIEIVRLETVGAEAFYKK